MRIEAPTLYSNPMLSRHYLLDTAPAELKEVASHATKPNQLNEVIQRVVRHDLIPVLSTPDGRHAVALFSPKQENFWAYYIEQHQPNPTGTDYRDAQQKPDRKTP
jgi:hypothetical protein